MLLKNTNMDIGRITIKIASSKYLHMTVDASFYAFRLRHVVFRLNRTGM